MRPIAIKNGSKGVPDGYPKVFRSREPRPMKLLGQTPENRKIASRLTGPDNVQMIGAYLAEMARFGCAKGVQRVGGASMGALDCLVAYRSNCQES